jgi:RES domain-containing protein
VARRDLIRALGRVRPAPFTGTVYRQISLGYQALSGEGARSRGGRWNPPQSFPVLYTSPSVDVVLAEIARKARRAGFAPADLMPRRLITYEVGLQRVLDLSDAGNREASGFSLAVVTDDDIRICQAIGEAAHYLGLEGILAPSAAAPGHALSIFLNKLLPGSVVDVVTDEVIEALP